jgi:phage virion morphogenesis protein
MGAFQITVNDSKLQIALQNFTESINRGSLLKIAGAVMRGSIEQTFREQGSPAGSWPALAPSTLLRDKVRGPGRQILIRSGRLKNSITYEVVGDDRLLIGTNLKYAAIQQLGGNAGRRPPFKKKGGKRPYIPARPYLVFRPEDPSRLPKAMEAYIGSQAKREGWELDADAAQAGDGRERAGGSAQSGAAGCQCCRDHRDRHRRRGQSDRRAAGSAGDVRCRSFAVDARCDAADVSIDAARIWRSAARGI